jgi:hypothetical protein
MNDLTVVEKLAEWQRLKALVLDSVSSPVTRRVYNMALDEFIDGRTEAGGPRSWDVARRWPREAEAMLSMMLRPVNCSVTHNGVNGVTRNRWGFLSV